MAINIQEASKPVNNIDYNLNPAIPMDLSSIQASVAALSQNVGQYIAERQATVNAVPKPEVPKAEPAKTSILDSLKGKVEMPKRDIAADMAEYQTAKQNAMATLGIGQAQFDELNQVNAETMTLSKELERLNLKEDAQIAQATAGFGLSSRAGAVENQIKRVMAIEKAGVAYQMSVKLGQAQLLQNKIDKAEDFFSKALDYATTKQNQEIADYKWALGYNLDLEKADRDYIQQQLENTYKEKADIRAQKQLELDQIKAGISGTATTGINTKIVGDFREDGASLKQQVRAGALSNDEAYAQLRDLYDPSEVTDDYIKQYLGMTTTETVETPGTTTASQVFGGGNFSKTTLEDRLKQLTPIYKKGGSGFLTGWKAMLRQDLVKEGYPAEAVKNATIEGNLITDLFDYLTSKK